MSTIHSSSALVGSRSALICGRARFSTVRSIEYSMQGSAITRSPVHSRRVARGAWTAVESLILPSWNACPRPF